jgi:hypothetical protein
MIRQFKLDQSQVCNCIYRSYPHRVTSSGVAIDQEAKEEMRRFTNEYATFLGIPKPYLRLDVYPNEEGNFNILEVNSSFVDGWGTALNLSRAVGISVVCPTFPQNFAYREEAYLPEIQLLVEELALQGREHVVSRWTGEVIQSTYVYGRVEMVSDLIYPWKGVEMDSKLHLAAFSKVWQGRRVEIPVIYTAETTEWGEIPEDVFLKFINKSGSECERARFSVKKGKPQGKSPFLQRCYREMKLIAQDTVPPMRVEMDEGGCKTVQLVILSSVDCLMGYVQFGGGDIINDNSIHGPLLFE